MSKKSSNDSKIHEHGYVPPQMPQKPDPGSGYVPPNVPEKPNPPRPAPPSDSSGGNKK
jgi:hypothetical protein